MRSLVLFVVAGCGGGSSQPIANQSNQRDAPPPDRDGLVQLLKPHGNHSLAAASGRGCPANETLGVWVARLLENGLPKDDGDLHRLSGGCGAHDAKMTYVAPPSREDAETYWYCTLDAYSSDPPGESPWSCGVFVRVRKSDRSVDLGSLVCPGTC